MAKRNEKGESEGANTATTCDRVSISFILRHIGDSTYRLIPASSILSFFFFRLFPPNRCTLSQGCLQLRRMYNTLETRVYGAM